MDPFANTSLAQTSRTLFTKKIQQFIAMMPPSNRSLDYIVDNPEAAEQILKANTTITQSSANRHMFFSAIVAYLKHTDAGRRRSERLQNRWLEIQKTNWDIRRDAALDNAPNPNQAIVASTLSWAQVVQMRTSLEAGTLPHLLLSLYTYIPPVRADYYEVKIINITNQTQNQSQTADLKTNFILLGPTAQTSSLVIRDFKTAAKYKEIKHTLPQPLYDTIKASLQAKPRSYLFTMPTDPSRPYDRGSFSKWANKVLTHLFKVPMTLTSLRHLFISTLDFNKTKARDLEQIGNAMGHSIGMQKGYQWIAEASESAATETSTEIKPKNTIQ
jgi:integrase